MFKRVFLFLFLYGCGGTLPIEDNWINEGKILSTNIQSGSGSNCITKVITNYGTFYINGYPSKVLLNSNLYISIDGKSWYIE